MRAARRRPGHRLPRLVAEQVGIGTIPGPWRHHEVGYVAQRARNLGRSPATPTRPPGHPATRETVAGLVDAGVNHIVPSLPRPSPRGVARWPADEVVARVR
ncbi:hypothetical protein [Streptomyces sp. YKOK-I1]